MAQFDVYRFAGGYALDCQSDMHDALVTRLVVPLAAFDDGKLVKRRLNPIFDVENERMVMMTEFALSAHRSELGARIASLEQHRYEVLGALDVLLTGV